MDDGDARQARLKYMIGIAHQSDTFDEFNSTVEDFTDDYDIRDCVWNIVDIAEMPMVGEAILESRENVHVYAPDTGEPVELDLLKTSNMKPQEVKRYLLVLHGTRVVACGARLSLGEEAALETIATVGQERKGLASFLLEQGHMSEMGKKPMHPLKQLMYPSSLAVYGASNNPLKMGTMQLANVLETGYRGRVYPIHPTESQVLGIPAYKSILEVGAPVDLVQLTLPTDVVPGALDECGRAGVRRAVVVSGGFKEAAGDKGGRLEGEIVEIAHRHGIRFLGPNCVGVFNSACGLNSTTIPMPPGGGKIALASQSGAYTAMINPLLRSQGIKMCQTLSVGNEADIDLADCLDYLREEPDVEAVGLYVETIRRPRAFIEAARETVRSKPVVAVYVGGTEAGSRSSLSHTGALTGPDEVYDGLFRQAGVMRADDMDQMLDFLMAFAGQPLPPGGRMAVLSNSGGPGTSLSYHIEKEGLLVPVFSSQLSERLDAVTGPLAFVRNPIDLTFEANLLLFKQLLQIVLESEEVDGAFLYGIFGWPEFMVNLERRLPSIKEMEETWETNYTEFLKQLAGVPRTCGKPLMVMSFIGAGSPSINPLRNHDVPVYPSASRAARAMRAMLAYRLAREGRHHTPT
jgi:acyl-CoA synthetase (NDP forming)